MLPQLEWRFGNEAGMGVEKAIVLQEVMGHLASKGADVIIAACTETPLLLPFVTQEVPVVDSTLALAKEVVSFALSR